jgi:hypothetical protein
MLADPDRSERTAGRRFAVSELLQSLSSSDQSRRVSLEHPEEIAPARQQPLKPAEHTKLSPDDRLLGAVEQRRGPGNDRHGGSVA